MFSHDFKAWDKFNVEQAMKDIDSSEEEGWKDSVN